MLPTPIVRIKVTKKHYDEFFEVELYNHIFVRVKGDYYTPLFSPMVLDNLSQVSIGESHILKDYLVLQHRKYLGDKLYRSVSDLLWVGGFEGDWLYKLMQKHLLKLTSKKERRIVKHFTPPNTYNDYDLLVEYYVNTLRDWHLLSFKKLHTLWGNAIVQYPKQYFKLITSRTSHVKSCLKTVSFYELPSLQVSITSDSIQVGTNKYLLLERKEYTPPCNNYVKLSIDELVSASDDIIENNLQFGKPLTHTYKIPEAYKPDTYVEYSPLLTSSGVAINFYEQSVEFMFIKLRTKCNMSIHLFNSVNESTKNCVKERVFVKVPFKKIIKVYYLNHSYTGIVDSGLFVINANGREFPMLCVGIVGKAFLNLPRIKVITRQYDEDEVEQWYALIKKYANPELWKEVWLKTHDNVFGEKIV